MHYTALLADLAAVTALSAAAPTASPANTRFTPYRIQERESSATNIPTEPKIFDSINSWIIDVDNINNFLNEATALLVVNDSSLLPAAQIALDFASNEPTQLQLQSSLPKLSAAGQNAVSNLSLVFGIDVIGSLNVIIANPTGFTAVLGAVNVINETRCQIVLLSVDNLLAAAASLPPVPLMRPNACSQ